MKKIKLLDNLYVFTQTEDDPELHANTYLLKGDKNILIDAGFLIPEDVSISILTHCHFDHSRYANDYQKRGAKICISKGDAKSLEKCDEIMQPKFAKELFSPAIPCKPNKILEDGDIIKNSNFKLKVISTPGHTPGSICLYEEKNRILFAGDTLFSNNHIGTWRHPGGDYVELLKSIAKIKKLDYDILCSGHGAIKWQKIKSLK